MAKFLRRPIGIALGALATTSLGGCYYGDVNGYGPSYAGNDCAAQYGNDYYDADPYAYDDGYGYDCYDGGDYGAGFAQIGFGGGWYDNYYYPGYGLWLFDNYNNRYPLRGQYLNYWGGRRAWWRHHGNDHDWRPGRGDGPRGDGSHGDGRPGRDNNRWDLRGDRDNDGPRGTRPPRPGAGTGNPPTTTSPVEPGRGGGRPGGWGGPGRGDNDGPRGPRPGAGNGNPPPPPTGTAPVRPGRPDRGPGAGRPPQSDGNVGGGRPRQQWQGNPGGGTVGTAPRPRPGGGGGGSNAAPPRPAPSQAAPPPRLAPPVTRSAPPTQSAPATRPSRADRPNRVRED